MHDDLNDSLDGMFGGPVAPRAQAPQTERAVAIREAAESFTEHCPACQGSGKFRSWSGRVVGDCFKCKGAGSRTFKSSPEARANGRAKAAEKRVTEAQEREAAAAAWHREHKAESAWLARAATWQAKSGGSFDFPVKMVEAIDRFGGLTENQLAAVRKLMIRDEAKRAEREAAKVTVDVSPITKAFDLARANAARPGMKGVWLRKLPMTAPSTVERDPGTGEVIKGSGQAVSFQAGQGKWDGFIFVESTDGRKLGNIREGKFSRKFHCTDAEAAAVIECAGDPLNSAKAFGQAWSTCCVCGQTLTNKDSIAAGIGPICAEKFGW